MSNVPTKISLTSVMNRVVYYDGKPQIITDCYSIDLYKKLSQIDINKVITLLNKKKNQEEEVDELLAQIRECKRRIRNIRMNKVPTTVNIEELYYDTKTINL